MELNEKQTQAIDYLENDFTNELLFGGGAGSGKSVLGCYWILKSAIRFHGSRWLIGRAKLKTLKETTLLSFFEVCKMQGLKAGVHYFYNKSTGEVHLANGSIIFLKDLFLYPSDPEFDELGSLEITGAFIDECNQIVQKCWNIVKSRIRYKLEDFNTLPKILGTCNPSKNWVYMDFYKPEKENKIEEYKKFIQALVWDNPHISKHYIENLKKLDKNSRERLLNGNWEYDDDPAKLYEVDEIMDLFTNKAEKSDDKFISADVARFGNDKTIVIYWEGLKAKIKAYTKKSTKETAEIIDKLSEEKQVRRSRIIIDEDGIGGGVVDQLSGVKGFLNGGKVIQPYEARYDETLTLNYGNLKAQCAFKLQEYMRAGKIQIECDEEIKGLIIEEFEHIKQKNIDSDGKIYLESKENIKANLGRSPDFFDAIMMRMFFELFQEIEFEFIEM